MQMPPSHGLLERPHGLVERLVEHILAGRDLRLEGPAGPALLAELPARLDNAWRIVSVTAPQGGLSLSALIAQLSGRDCFDDQDDGALELGFRRLALRDPDAPHTLLLLDAVQGLQRPVLRYLQHVGGSAPALVFAVAAGPDLDGLLSDPSLAKLRLRLAKYEIGDEPAELPAADTATPDVTPDATTGALCLVPPAPQPGALVPVAIPPDWNLDTPALVAAPKRARRRAWLWVASGVGMAASVAVGGWLGHASAGLDRLAALEAATNVPLAVAPPAPPTLVAADTAPQPAPAPAPPAPSLELAPPTTVPAPLPGRLAGRVAPQTATSAPPALAQAAPPASTVAGQPPTVFADLAPSVVDSDGPSPAPRGEAHRVVHPVRRHAWTPARPPADDDPARFAAEARSIPFYGTEGLPPEPRARSPRPASVAADPYRRDDPAGERPFIGTFSTQPYARPYAAQPYAAQPYAAQPYAAQPYAGQAYGAQSYGDRSAIYDR